VQRVDARVRRRRQRVHRQHAQVGHAQPRHLGSKMPGRLRLTTVGRKRALITLPTDFMNHFIEKYFGK
jgi:hypothetical protein